MTDDAQAPVEIELKFELAVGQTRRLARHPAMAAVARPHRMTTTYFDTPRFALRQAGFSLRVRRVRGRFVQTVKRDREGLFDRDEWESVTSALRVDMVAIDATPAGKVLAKTGEPLVPVAAIVTSRIIRHFLQNDSLIEIAVDRCEVRAGEARLRFSELELELKHGTSSAIFDLAKSLFAITPLRIGLTSKGQRGYHLAGASALPFDPAVHPEMDAAQAFAAVARACLEQIVSHAAAFRADPAPEGIHQTRVGLRRLRTAFRLFEGLVDDHEGRRLNAEAEWAAVELGSARNLDVFLDDVFAPEVLSDPGVAKRYGERLQAARTVAYARAQTALTSARFASLALDLALWIEDGTWRHPRDDAERAVLLRRPVGDFAAEALEGLRRAVRKRGRNLETLNADDRHRLRIRCKRLRYASEFFAHAFPGGRKKREAFVSTLKDLQNALGLLNDMAQAQASAAETLGKGAPKDLIFAAGELVGRLRARQGKNLEKSVAGYKALLKSERFWPKPNEAEPLNEGF